MGERIRGALFNSLGDISGQTVLEPFAGSGALSFEALSRGAAGALLLERDKKAQATIERNIAALGLTEKAVRDWVDILFQQFLLKSGEHATYSKEIQQGVRARSIRARGEMRMTTHPWQTQWCIAKILYETVRVFFPDSLIRKLHGALSQLCEFLQEKKESRGIFLHKTLGVNAEPRHDSPVKYPPLIR